MTTHPERVAAAVPADCKIVALLHDAVEDGHTTQAEVDAVLPGPESHAIELLTRPPLLTYAEYIELIARVSTMTGPATGHAGRIARAVKIADLRDNLYGRPEGPPPESLRKRYEKALAVLEAAA
jgi:hypothetical protein